jgi:isoquinoline 1-oxidoreductase alpha subunit
MTVNGEALRFRLDPDTPLLWALRDAANLTGTKYGCDSRDCGACTVMVDGQAVLSCAATIGSLEGAEVVTIEGLSAGRSHPLQRAWSAEQVSQCGYCEPGMIMALAALLKASPKPQAAELAGIANICRCGIGPRVLKAVRRASAAAASAAPGRGEAARRSSPLSNGSSGSEQDSTQ